MMTEKSDKPLPDLIPDIFYLIPVEDGGPWEASFLQGFARSLMDNVGLIRFANMMPSDIWELTPEGLEIRLPRRMSGQTPVRWFGQSPKALRLGKIPAFSPFVVLLLGKNHDIEAYQDWINSHPFPVVVVAKEGGLIAHEELSLESLRSAFLDICDAIRGKVDEDQRLEAKANIESWLEPQEIISDFKVGGHNTVYPNVLSLFCIGYRDIVFGRFDRQIEGINAFVEQIVITTRFLLKERERIGERQAHQYFRRPPSLNLFIPSIYPHFNKMQIDGQLSSSDRRRFIAMRRMLMRQDGYHFQASTEAQARALLGSDRDGKPDPHFLLTERAAELKLATECVASLAVSEVSAVIRLPNAVNRTSGQVRQHAQQYHAKQITERKKIEGFRRVQEAITDSIPKDFFEFIEGAQEGIRLISDAHLEWLSIRGLPLCVQKDVSRIPVTPGNLFLQQVSAQRYEHIAPSDFEEVLVLSALQDDDPISRFFDIAIGAFNPHFKERVRIRTERVRNEADLVRALESFDGAMMIFDGHGSHEQGGPATLQLLEEKIDVWRLQELRPRIPPIIILSACDTHAADRNHASTANGFLSAGARAVLGSVFPVNAMDAASFVARLLFRIAEFIPLAHKILNRSLTWMEIIGGMIRMQLLTDFCMRLQRKGMIDQHTYLAVHERGNYFINIGDEWPFEQVIDLLAKHGVDEESAWCELRAATANSTAISYLHLGRPETIIVHPDSGFRDARRVDQEEDASTRPDVVK
jgi:hypothetical protein